LNQSDLKIFKTLWGWKGSFDEACRSCADDGFDGVEVNLDHPCLEGMTPKALKILLKQWEQDLIVEVLTGGDYTPDLSLDWEQHIDQVRDALQRAVAFHPLKISLITGSDHWDEDEQHRFLDAVLNLANACSVPVSLETHRSRSLFNPWRLPSWLQRHPCLRLTADLSHWCAVTERLMTPDLAVIQAMAPHVDHIHARVGHAQGPSVSHPFAPEWAEALEAHQRCWQLFLDARPGGKAPMTITPEFGPDGYMPQMPFSAEPLVDVERLNAAMAIWLRSELKI